MKPSTIDSFQVDKLNIGLILLSLLLAFLLPFRTFLYAYAIIGPLHYLTEINWLHTKQYFTSGWAWMPISALAAFIIVIPKLLQFTGLLDVGWIETLAVALNNVSNGILFLGLWVAMIIVLFERPWIRVALVFLGLVVSFFANNLPLYTLLVGLLLPTVVHVYVFTVLFMLYGALKSGSKTGLFSVLLVCLVPFIISFIEPDHTVYNFPDWVKQTFVASGFHTTNIGIAKLFGLTDGKSFFFYGPWELKLQRFIAFAYLYHYLNWFSKTTVIGWHQKLKRPRVYLILGIWLSLVLLFAVDYRIGFYGAIGFSMLHVILEFPLNVVSAKGIIELLRKRIT